MVVLWVMRDIPTRSSDDTYPRLTVTDVGMVPDEALIQQWMDANQETSVGIFTSKRFFTPNVQVWLFFLIVTVLLAHLYERLTKIRIGRAG